MVTIDGPAGGFENGAGLVREELHTRRIDMRAYRRSDGLYEVEGRVVDTKPYDFAPGGTDYRVSAGRPIHDISLTLVYDDDMVVRDVRTAHESAPYDLCPASGLAMRAIIGLRIGKGWTSETRRRLETSHRCTHLAELLGPLATTAIQSMSMLRQDRPEPVDANGRPIRIDSCYAYNAGRSLVERRWPEFYEPAA